MQMKHWVGFASAGGIVPALSAVNRLLASADTTRVWLFYDRGDAPDSAEISDALEELLLLKDRNMTRLSLGIVMEREADEAALLSGRLDSQKIRAITGKLLASASTDEYFVCGPGSFAGEVKSALAQAGVSPGQVHVEHAHGAAPSVDSGAAKPASAAERETQVSFVMDGRRRSFTMRTNDESILDAADRAGIELPFSCKAGVCATCRTKLVKGKVDLMENSALEDWELEQGFILACQARARTPEIELTYDEK
jgi:ring-1,2-phenylacetyl-CoA epoxidase subunit PaaE